MEALLSRQNENRENIAKIKINFSKDSESRKTIEYFRTRLEALDNLWNEFENNHRLLSEYPDSDEQYFTENIFEKTYDLYQTTRKLLTSQKSYLSQKNSDKPPSQNKASQKNDKVDELLIQQQTNFRAFNRVVKGINLDQITEKWELEDELRNVQLRFNAIDNLHLQIDNFLQGEDTNYEQEFCKIEALFKKIKRSLNIKLSSSAHLHQSTPQLEIPIFTGKYTQWPTFCDLFSETIHNSTILTKAQKMQHLKGKVRGEAERLIQHLHISADNYDTAWELLYHRYNNPQVLFSKQIEVFLNQPCVQKQTAFELKKLYDTSSECIHAIHNLGVDTTTWDPLLVHLICKKLDVETYTDYKEARKSPRDLPSLDEFMTFLEGKFTALETINKRDKGLPGTNKQVTQHKFSSSINHPNRFHHQKSFPTFATSSSRSGNQVSSPKCSYCKQDHALYQCPEFMNLSPEQKLRSINKLNICQNCLFEHRNKCFSVKRCKECNGAHNTILHDACTKSMNPSTSQSPTSAITPTKGDKRHNVNHVASEDEEILLTTVQLRIRAANGTYITFRALLDQGSQISLISENAAQLLGLERKRYQASVRGIGNAAKQSKGVVNLDCQSTYEDYHFSTQALVITKVINNLPNCSFGKQSWLHLRNINLADPDYNISKPIDLLLDASVYSDILMNGLIKGPERSPIAQQTKLGWILSGSIHTKSFNCHVVINNLEDIAKYWEIEEINSKATSLSPEDQYCEDFYNETTRRLESGRYEVALPMKPGYEQHLGTSKIKAIGQFKQLEQKFIKHPTLASDYKKFMDEYRKLGHMRLIESNVINNKIPFYLPHHGVLRLDSTSTKLRVVFNGSAKSSSGKSLNDLMECGSNLQKDLMALILSWRQYTYVLTADIEKMFRQVMIRDADHHLQRIIWRDSRQDPIQEYELTTVTYGTKAAPYLAMRTLQQLAKDDAKKYPQAAFVVEHCFYTDDLLCGDFCLIRAKQLQQQLISLLNGAGMNLHKWASNTPELIKEFNQQSEGLNTAFDFKCTETRKTLGLGWDSRTDSFVFQNKLSQDIKLRHTKRELLSEISKCFDPLGWLSPLTIRAKLLFQKTWNSELTWDEILPLNIENEWLQLRDDLRSIAQFTIPRYLGNILKHYQIHCFCDASEKAYACVIYIVALNNKGEYTSNIVAAKTKLAPIKKKISLPRLELCGALLSSKLLNKVLLSIPHESIAVHAWTDSMVVLGWLQGNPDKWNKFVANRVQQITNIIPASQWNHVKSNENAADCATRGLSTAKLASRESCWWKGPNWLLTQNFNEISNKYAEPTIEIKKTTTSAVVQLNNYSDSIINKLLCAHSSITYIAKVVAWVSRFISRCKDRTNAESGSSLTPLELCEAYQLIIKHEQMHYFKTEINDIHKNGHVKTSNSLSCLNPFLDKNNILRVGGRLKHSTISNSAKHPIIISKHSRFTELIIHQAHITTLHGGAKLTLSYIRDRYWIISGVNTVKKQLRQCVICKRFKHSNQQQIMADLPPARVTPSRPFTHSGVDFTGHVEVKCNKGRGIRTSKGYIAVFVCMATKAVHLEIVSDLSTQGFLAAFRRFCARRGTPNHLYSDNGRNFIGANRLLKKEYQAIMETVINKKFMDNLNEINVIWHFNAPAWPSAGGLWEAAVKSLKHHLKRVIGDQKLTYEEFSTLLLQIEACLNSRPLCNLTEDPDDECLTPGHFLVGGPLLSRPQTEPENMTLSQRWQLVQSMNKRFWKSWSSEYLQQLHIRSKWRTPTENLNINDVVLIKEENMPPGKWAMGRIVQLHPGSDGYVRVVSIKTQNSIMKRPISKLTLLPTKDQKELSLKKHCLSPAQQQTSDSHAQQQTSSPQQNRPHTRKGIKNILFSTLFLLIMIVSPGTSTQENEVYNITKLPPGQGLFFDKITDLQFIRDEWKLVVYYNMSTYWNGMTNIKNYVSRLKSVCNEENSQLRGITTQLQHEIDEIEHYNKILTQQQRIRQKRGLINGVGYVANTLFGVLDDRFAQQYEQNIEKIQLNENHLQALIKNQTLVVEAEYNIMRRNEDVMNSHFRVIDQHLHDLSAKVNETSHIFKCVNHIMSSAVTADIIISNIRRIQQVLIDTVTDIYQGHIDTHLLSPEQLQKQLFTISTYLQADLSTPVDNVHIRDLYKLLKVSARVMQSYLIIEIIIPIVSNEFFEVHKIISIPQSRDKMTYQAIPVLPFLAYNTKQDKIILLSEIDLKSCLHLSNIKLYCSLDRPLYNLKSMQSICDITLVDSNNKSPCVIETSTCNDNWVKLHARNSWLFSCCEKCTIRIFCTAGWTVNEIINNGIITLGQGCTLSGDSFTIFGHNHYMSNLQIQQKIVIPELSMLNKIINTSITLPEQFTSTTNSNWQKLKDQIETLKEQSSSTLTVHDVHQYTLIYSVVAVLLLLGIIIIIIKIRSRRQQKKRNPAATATTTSQVERAAAPAAPPAPPSVREARELAAPPPPTPSVSEVNVSSVRDEINRSVTSVNKATSPLVSRSIKFRIQGLDSE